MSASPVAIVLTKITPADHDYPQLLAETLQEFGWHVIVFPTRNVDDSVEFKEKFVQLIHSSEAAAVFSINFTSIIGNLSVEAGFTYLAWNEVYPLTYELEPYPIGNRIWCFDSSKSLTEWWRQRNVNSHFYPMGFDERIFRRQTCNQDIDVSLVGNGLAHYEKLYNDLQRQALEALNTFTYQNDAIRHQAFTAISRFLDKIEQMSFAQFEAVGCDIEAVIDHSCEELHAPYEVIYAVHHTLSRARKCLMGYYSRRQRVESLMGLVNCGALKVFGRDWEGTPIASYALPPASFTETASIFARSRISLNVQRFYAKNINDRLLNVPAAGGFLLTRLAEGVDELFEPDQEIAVYTSVEDLIDKVRFYLSHPEERRRITETAYRRVYGQYRFKQRLWEVLGISGLPRPPQMPRLVR